MKQIELTQGFFAIVDDEDYERIAQLKWFASRQSENLVYAARNVRLPDGKQAQLLMHREIAGATKWERIDHWDGNGLMNCRSNLRHCSHAENMRNRKMQCNNTSGYRGVHYIPRDNKWMSLIRVNGKRLYLGQYSEIIDAAQSYDRAAVHHFGAFARTNFPIQ